MVAIAVQRLDTLTSELHGGKPENISWMYSTRLELECMLMPHMDLPTRDRLVETAMDIISGRLTRYEVPACEE
jgi:hypothetical protein